VNVGQRVTYMVTGWLPEHVDERERTTQSEEGQGES